MLMAELNSTQGISMVSAAASSGLGRLEASNINKQVLRLKPEAQAAVFLPPVFAGERELDPRGSISTSPIIWLLTSSDIFHLVPTNPINLQEMSFSILVSKLLNLLHLHSSVRQS